VDGQSHPRARGTCYLPSDNGSEFIAKAVQAWLSENAIKTTYIDPGSPWQNGYVESFHGRLRDECLNREQFWTLTEARVVIEDYRREYNTFRPHSKAGHLSPKRFAARKSAPSPSPVDLWPPYLEDGQPNNNPLENNTTLKDYLSTGSKSRVPSDINRLADGNKGFKMYIWNLEQPSDSVDHLVEQLTRSEHQRWMAVKIMEGWRWSGNSDPQSRRLHDMLDHLFIPFDELPEGSEG